MSEDETPNLMSMRVEPGVSEGSKLLARAHPLCLGGNVFGWTVDEG